MTNRFYAGQTNYIEEMNALDGETGDHIADTTGAHAATAISNTPAGNIAATTVQAAINELDTEKLSASATTLPASFTASSLTSVGTLTALTVSGQASFSAGSAAAPSVKVGAEQNGLYSSAANTLDVALNGVRQFQFGYTASAVNCLQATGSTTGNETRLRVQGSDTNAGMLVTTKGNGVIRMETGGGEQFRVSHTASAVNYAQITGSATGLSVVYGAAGSDAAVPVVLTSKGAANVTLYTNSGGNPGLSVAHTALSVNYATVSPGTAGNAVAYGVAGSDTNVALGLYSKNAGTVFAVVQNALALTIANQASAVNSLVITGAATGNSVQIATTGSDSNRSISINATGTGRVAIGTGAGGVVAGFGTYDSAEKAIYILNTTNAPTANPATGGYLYCEGGALKYRGSSGTVSTIAAA